MVRITLEIEGMKCGMCETHVNDVIRKCGGVKKVSSSHAKNKAVVIAEDGADENEIARAVSAQGYGVRSVSRESYVKKSPFSFLKK